MSSIVLSGDTSGTVTVAVPAVAGTNTVTIAAQTGTLYAAAPAFSAYLGTNQSFTASTITKVTFDVENFDTNNNFASSRFTPTIAGYYQLNTAVDISTTTSITRFLIQFWKNGSAYTTPQDFATSALRTSASGLFYFNGSTDYMEIYVYAGGVSPVVSSGQTTSFNGFLVRGA